MLATNARAKGLAVSGLWLKYDFYHSFHLLTLSLTTALRSIVSFVNTYAAPVGITNSSWRFYFLYLVVDFVGIFVIYFTFVETHGRSLEEMDHIFADSHPVTASLAMQKVALQETKEGGVNAVQAVW